MAIVFICPRCDRKYSVAENMAGRRVTCKACGQEFSVPGTAPQASAPSAWSDDDGESIAMAPPKPRTIARSPVPKPARGSADDDFDDVPPPPRTRARPRTSERASRGRSAASDANLATIVGGYLVINVSAFLISVILGVTHQVDPAIAGYYVGILFGATSLGMIAIGLIGMIMVAFNESPEQGMLCLIPGYQIAYLARNYDEAKRPFAILFTGAFCLALPFLIVGGLIFGFGRSNTTKASDAIRLNREVFVVIQDMNRLLDQIHDAESAKTFGPQLANYGPRLQELSNRLKGLGYFTRAENEYVKKTIAPEARPLLTRAIANCRRIQGLGLGFPNLGKAIANFEKELNDLGPPGDDDEPVWTTGGGVVVFVDGVGQSAEQELFIEKLKKIADPDGTNELSVSVNGTSKPGQNRIQIEPVGNVQDFASKITFGKVTKRDGWKIYVTADLPVVEVEARRKLLAERKKTADAEAAARDKEQKAQAEVDRKRNEFVAAEAKSAREAQENARYAPPLATKVDPSAGPIDKAIAETRARDHNTVKEAVKRLAHGIPENRRQEVLAALIPMLQMKEIFTVNEVIKTLVALNATEAVPGLIEILDVTFVDRNAMEALGSLGDPRAAGPIAERIESAWPAAGEALKAIGPSAEDAVIPLLRHKKSRTRQLALEVLAEIGGKEALKTMQSLPADPDTFVRMAANDTMKKIMTRTGVKSLERPRK